MCVTPFFSGMESCCGRDIAFSQTFATGADGAGAVRLA